MLLDESTRAKRFSFSCVCNFLITTFNATALSRIKNPDFQCIVTDNVIASFPFLNICLPDTAMETCSDTSWSQSENTGMLIHRLKSNPYFSALQSSIAKSRKRWLEVNRTLLVTIIFRLRLISITNSFRQFSAWMTFEYLFVQARGDNTCDIALVPCSAACSPPPHQFEVHFFYC